MASTFLLFINLVLFTELHTLIKIQKSIKRIHFVIYEVIFLSGKRCQLRIKTDPKVHQKYNKVSIHIKTVQRKEDIGLGNKIKTCRNSRIQNNYKMTHFFLPLSFFFFVLPFVCLLASILRVLISLIKSKNTLSTLARVFADVSM